MMRQPRNRRQKTRHLSLETLELRRVLATVTLNTDLGLAGELRTAIATAALGEVIDFNLPAGSETIALAMGQLQVDQPLTIDGANLAGSGVPVTIDGMGLSRVLNIDDGAPQISNVTIENLTITGGNSSADPVTTLGGGIRNVEFLTIQDSVISSNEAEFGGGLANTYYGTTLLTDTRVADNRASGRGGGVYNNSANYVEMLRATVTGNVVYGDGMYSVVGGGVSNFDSQMTIASSTITGNSAGHDDTLYAAAGLGAGIGNDYYGELTVTDSMVSGNTADFGGGVWLDDYSLNFFDGDTHFDGNTVHERGGGIFATDGSSVYTNGSSISGNMAIQNAGVGTTDGAAIFAGDGVTLTLDNATIENNYAFDRGGAIYASAFGDPDGVDIRISNSTVAGNSSLDLGGAIQAGAGVTLLIEGTTLSGNSTANDGGAIRMSTFDDLPMTNVTIRSSTLTGNSAGDDGGAIGQSSYSLLVVENTFIDGNYAYDRGGGIYSRGDFDSDVVPTLEFPSRVEIRDSILTNNVAIDDGGGFHGGVLLTTVIEGTQISGNSVISRGGGVRVSFNNDYDASFSMDNSNVSGNYASDSGGGISISQGVVGSITNSTVDGNTSFGSGGGIVNYSGSSLSVSQSTISNNSASNTGGGIDTTTANFRMEQSTVSGNSTSATGGGVYLTLDYALAANYTLEMDGATITNNYAIGAGGGIYNGYYSDPTVANSIISGNTTGSVGPDFYATALNNVSYSLIGDNSSSSLAEANPDASGNIIGGPIGGVVDALLGPLQNNGGTTLTHEPSAGSPAIDAGDPSILPGTTADQRGFERVADGRADMGAVETNSSLLVNGDFNGDGDWDCDDIDALVMTIVDGLNDPAFDMTQDGLVNLDDITDAVDGWLRVAGEINLGPGKSYLVGDANLDGIVDGLDFILWNDSKFTATPAWCSGDFNADGIVDGLDFILWNDNKFMSSDAVTFDNVPREFRLGRSNVDDLAENAEFAEPRAEMRAGTDQDRSVAPRALRAPWTALRPAVREAADLDRRGRPELTADELRQSHVQTTAIYELDDMSGDDSVRRQAQSLRQQTTIDQIFAGV